MSKSRVTYYCPKLHSLLVKFEIYCKEKNVLLLLLSDRCTDVKEPHCLELGNIFHLFIHLYIIFKIKKKLSDETEMLCDTSRFGTS